MTQSNDSGVGSYTQDINNNFEAAKAAIANISSTCAPISLVQTVNGKQNAITSSNKLAGSVVDLAGYEKAASAAAISASDTVNAAIGKLEKALDGKQASGSYASSSHTHSGMVTTSDIVGTVTSSSTNASPVGAKLFYDTVGNIEAALTAINGE